MSSSHPTKESLSKTADSLPYQLRGCSLSVEADPESWKSKHSSSTEELKKVDEIVNISTDFHQTLLLVHVISPPESSEAFRYSVLCLVTFKTP